MGLRSWITARIVRFLTRPLGRYERRGVHDFERLGRVIRKGDVLLVEGDQRVSAVIRTLTHSCWSHAALYIGDELLRRGGEQREEALARFGDGAHHLMVEALFEGVVISPLEKYVDFNVRLCRPHKLRPEHLEVVLDDAIAAVGWRYDVRNILDLAIHLLLLSLFPGRSKRESDRLGSAARTEVICSSLLGQLFSKVGFPVLASVSYPDGRPPASPAPRSLRGLVRRLREPYPGVFRQRHPTLLAPRDFDLSPYFEIVKFDAIAGGRFDYQRIAWASEGAEEPEEATPARRDPTLASQ